LAPGIVGGGWETRPSMIAPSDSSATGLAATAGGKKLADEDLTSQEIDSRLCATGACPPVEPATENCIVARSILAVGILAQDWGESAAARPTLPCHEPDCSLLRAPTSRPQRFPSTQQSSTNASNSTRARRRSAPSGSVSSWRPKSATATGSWPSSARSKRGPTS